MEVTILATAEVFFGPIWIFFGLVMVLHTVRLKRLKPSICPRPKSWLNYQPSRPGTRTPVGQSKSCSGKMQVNPQTESLQASFSWWVLLISGNQQIFATMAPTAIHFPSLNPISFRRTTKTAKGSSGLCFACCGASSGTAPRAEGW